MAGRSGGGWLALRLCACAAWYSCAGLRVWYLLRPLGWRRWRMAGRPANCWSWPPPCRLSAAVPTAAPIGAAHPDRLPPVDDLPPRPPVAPVCRSAVGQAEAAAEGIYRARSRLLVSYANMPPIVPQPVQSAQKIATDFCAKIIPRPPKGGPWEGISAY